LRTRRRFDTIGSNKNPIMKTVDKIKNTLRIQGLLFVLALAYGNAYAQTFVPPTVLPPENVNYGGSGAIASAWRT